MRFRVVMIAENYRVGKNLPVKLFLTDGTHFLLCEPECGDIVAFACQFFLQCWKNGHYYQEIQTRKTSVIALQASLSELPYRWGMVVYACESHNLGGKIGDSMVMASLG